MERWVGKVALVTGASAGIGEAITRLLVKNGMKVLGVSRNPDKIQEIASTLNEAPGKLFSKKCDIRNEADVKEMFEFAKKELGGVDVVINNAGLSHHAPLLDPNSATADWKDMLETNVLALCVVNREFMAQMKDRGIDDGQIIILNSIVGYQVVNFESGLHFYSATKFATTALINGTRFELRNMKSNIRIASISPGMVKTEFEERFRKIDKDKAKANYENAFETGPVLEPEDVASAVLYILSAPQRAEVNDVVIRPTAEPF